VNAVARRRATPPKVDISCEEDGGVYRNRASEANRGPGTRAEEEEEEEEEEVIKRWAARAGELRTAEVVEEMSALRDW